MVPKVTQWNDWHLNMIGVTPKLIHFLIILSTFVRKSSGRFFVVLEWFSILILVMVIKIHTCDKISLKHMCM